VEECYGDNADMHLAGGNVVLHNSFIITRPCLCSARAAAAEVLIPALSLAAAGDAPCSDHDLLPGGEGLSGVPSLYESFKSSTGEVPEAGGKRRVDRQISQGGQTGEPFGGGKTGQDQKNLLNLFVLEYPKDL
jgi:hypothetical protein